MSSESKYLPITLNPGINRDSTSYGSEGTWYEMDKVRFRNGYPQCIGGWQENTPNTFKGIARSLTDWSNLIGEPLLALGTHNHLYILKNDVFNDITPVSVSSSLTNNLSTSVGSTYVTVSIDSHGREVGDFVYVISQATTVGGNINLSGEYELTEVVDDNSFVVDTSTTAAATSLAAGGSLNFVFPIQSGYQSNNEGFGYGAGGYGEGAWSEPSSVGLIRSLRYWSTDNWGEDLLASPSGGAVYYWDNTNGVGVRSFLVSAAPSENSFISIDMPSRQVVSFGTVEADTSVFNPMLIRWSSSEDYTDWVPTDTNTAGDYPLQDGSKIVGRQQTKVETLVWTDKSLWAMKYIGGNDVYSFERLGLDCGLLGPLATIDIGGAVFWMGVNGFWRYDGQISPLKCTLLKDLFNEDGAFAINLFQREKTICGHNSQFKEIIWFYQSVNSITDDCDSYVIYNYSEDVWYYGTLDRSCWLDIGIFNHPLALASDGSGKAYEHELGLSGNNMPFSSFISSAEFDIDDGDELMFVDRIVPDFNLTGSLQVTMNFRNYPNGPVTTKGPYTFSSIDKEYADIRARGRQMSLKISSNADGSSWQLGKTRLRVRTNGRV